MIRKWWHNRKNKEQPMCPCGWRMIPATRPHFDSYWICFWKECTWAAWSNGGKLKFWREQS